MARFKQFWINIKDSFWFIPAIINLFLIGLALLIIQFDRMLGTWEHPIRLQYFSFPIDSVRTFLATVAGSMMTIAGVVFSITILVLAQTAGQYSSRVLRNFMKKKSNQVILGLFVGIFIFCLFLITNLHPEENGLTALTGFLFALTGVGFLIYFIHQTSISIQASEIIRNIQEETIQGIEFFFPNPYENERPVEKGFDLPFSIASQETGYIQAINKDSLLGIALEKNTQIQLNKKMGDFVARGEPIFFIGVEADEVLCSTICRAVVIGRYRSATQDVAFGVEQMVDVALRGLSPGINDLSTAQTAVDYLGSLYIQLANRDLGSPIVYHEDQPVLYIPVETFESFLEMGLKSVCSSAKGQPTIQKCITQTIETIKRLTKAPERKALLENYSCNIN